MVYRPNYLSASQLATYAECPGLYRERYLERAPMTPNVPMWFGLAVHSGLEAHFRGADGDAAFRKVWKAKRTELEASGVHVPAQLLLRGLDLIERVADLDIQGIPEQQFWLRWDGLAVPVMGYQDLIDAEHGVVYDFKTTGGTWTQSYADAQVFQPALYCEAFKSLHGTYPRFEYIVLSRNDGTLTRLDGTRDEAAIALVKEHAEAIHEAILAQQFDCACGKGTHHVDYERSAI